MKILPATELTGLKLGGRKFDACGLLRFQLPSEAWLSEHHVAVLGTLFIQHGGA